MTTPADPFDLHLDAQLCLVGRDAPREVLAVLRDLQQSVQDRVPAPPAAVPNLARLVAQRLPWSEHELSTMPVRRLWALHAAWEHGQESNGTGASLLTLKRLLATRQLTACRLCAWKCGVNRQAGDRGRCGLDAGARLARLFINYGDEPEIAPTLVVAPAGCSWRCPFCQYHRALSPAAGTPWIPETVARAMIDVPRREEERTGMPTRTIQFMGGNPDESLPTILQTLEVLVERDAGAVRPVVWNANGFATRHTMRLLYGVVDHWLLDMKHGSEACAARLGAGPRAVAVGRACARAALELGQQQSRPYHSSLIVRLLILPGHIECCAQPILRWVARRIPEAQISLLHGQYAPSWRAQRRDGSANPLWPELALPLSTRDYQRVRTTALDLRLQLVGDEIREEGVWPWR